MPGFFSHLIAGYAMFIISKYYFKNYFDNKNKEQLLLGVVCLSFSLIPDFPLGFYYMFHISSFDILLHYHTFLHIIISPIAIVILLILKYWVNTKREPIWVIGLGCIVLHIAMDIFIPETGVLF